MIIYKMAGNTWKIQGLYNNIIVYEEGKNYQPVCSITVYCSFPANLALRKIICSF